MGVEAAIIGGAIIGGGMSLIGSSRAAGAASDASRNATQAELQMYNQSRTDLAPYRERGYQALDMISQLYGLPSVQTGTAGAAPSYTPSGAGGITGFMQNLGNAARAGAGGSTAGRTYGTAPATRDLSAFYTSPNYEFVRDEGMKGITNLASARGGIGGQALRQGAQFAGNLASGEFNNYVNRLASIAGIGQTAVNTGVAAGSNTAGNLANIYTNAGNARASSYLAGAGGVNNAIQGGLQNWAFNNYLQNGAGSSIPYGWDAMMQG